MAHSVTASWIQARFLHSLTIVGAVALGLAVVMLPMKSVLVVIASVSVTMLALSSIDGLLAVSLVLKPLIDMTWSFGLSIAGITINTASALSVLVSISALYWLVSGAGRLPNGLKWWLALFAVLNSLAILLAPTALIGIEGFLRVMSGFALLLIVGGSRVSFFRTARLLRLFVLIMLLVQTTVLLQPLGLMPYSSSDAGLARATGFFYHPWDVARYLIVVVPVALYIRDYLAQKKQERVLMNLTLLLAIAVAYFTYLKLAWFLVGAELIVWSIWHKRFRTLVAGLFGVVIAGSPVSRDPLQVMFSDLWMLFSEGSRDQALSGRIWLWRQYLEYLGGTPVWQLVFGQGFGVSTRTGLIATHNDGLRLVFTNGLLGTFAYLGVVVTMSRALWGSARRRVDTPGRMTATVGLARAALCVMVAYVLSGLTTDASAYPSLSWYVWTLTGLALGHATWEYDGEHVVDTPIAAAVNVGAA